MAELKWQRGNFLKFFAKMKMNIGAQKGLAIHANDEFEYDGSILRYAGLEVNTVELRGAYKSGWFTLDQEDTTIPEAHVAERNIAKATTVNRDLSKVQRNGHGNLDSTTQDEDTVMSVDDRRPKQSGSKVLNVSLDNASPKVMTRDNNRRSNMPINNGPDDQEAVFVGRVRTATHLKADVTDSKVGRIQSDLENLNGSGLIRSQTVHREGISIKTTVGSGYGVPSDEGRVVGQVRNTEAKTSMKAGKIEKNLNPKVRIARRIDPSFPSDWDFTGRLADRLERVKEYGENPDFLTALYAAEGDPMRKKLEKVYPKIFR